MRINRRGSVTIEALMLLPIAVALILLGRFVLEASLNRQEIAIYARGSAINAGLARSDRTIDCIFDDAAFEGRTSVDQTEAVDCNWRDSERGLSREQPMWDEVEAGAAPWDDILRDVKPRNSPRDVVAHADVSMALTSPSYLSGQNPVEADQYYLAPENILWTHDENKLHEGHDLVIWDQLCKEPTYQLFPNVFPNAGDRC